MVIIAPSACTETQEDTNDDKDFIQKASVQGSLCAAALPNSGEQVGTGKCVCIMGISEVCAMYLSNICLPLFLDVNQPSDLVTKS